jgi:hypothetical protein
LWASVVAVVVFAADLLMMRVIVTNSEMEKKNSLKVLKEKKYLTKLL